MANTEPTKITSIFPKRRQDMWRWDGWGYKDSQLAYRNGTVTFVGDRYPLAGRLNNFRDWVFDMFKIHPSQTNEAATPPTEFPEPKRNEEFLAGLKDYGIDFSEDGMDRIMRSHACHEQVVRIVKLAEDQDIVLIPVGGNTSVSLASTTPQIYDRTIAVLDMTQMNWNCRETRKHDC
ncbi:hypothetical protein pipiens_002889 [Culex pipiens pipiens]|uniref:Alkylglycerone-phosphate synthase n=1 Tax=Culex pipiens pipiens TaxID=38569 RepID=A0ABD1D6E7_CULPP